MDLSSGVQIVEVLSISLQQQQDLRLYGIKKTIDVIRMQKNSSLLKQINSNYDKYIGNEVLKIALSV